MKLRALSAVTTLLLCFVFVSGFSQPVPDSVVNLKPRWQVYDGTQYVPFDALPGRPSSIYFSLERAAPGERLMVTSSIPFTFLINNKLIAGEAQALNLAADSLIAKHGNSAGIWVSIHQREIAFTSLRTWLTKPKTVPEAGALNRPRSFFRDFVILCTLVLLIVLVVMVQLNARLAADYFSVIRIFSIRESTDRISEARLTDGVNVLFYCYTSLIIGLFLMIIFRFAPFPFPVAVSFQSHTLPMAVLNWILLSVLVLGAIFLKFLVLQGVTWLFNMRDQTQLQFLNWIRLLLVTFGALLVIVLIYNLSHGASAGVYAFFYSSLRWVFAGWVLLILFKVGGKAEFTKFHIFSYICATEVIPLLITIKLLYN